MKIPIIQGNEKIHFGEKLQSRRGAVSYQAVFVKYSPDSKFFREIMKGMLKFIFLVMFYMVGYFNNSRA